MKIWQAWQHPIEENDVSNTELALTHGGIRMRVHDSKVYLNDILPTTKPNPSFMIYKKYTIKFLCRQQHLLPLSKADVVLSFGDACNAISQTYPVLGENTDIIGNCQSQIPVPLYYWYWNQNGADDFGEQSSMRVSNMKVPPWESRKSMIYWKGGLHGSGCRQKIYNLRNTLPILYIPKEIKSPSNIYNYKYALNIPGWGVSIRFRNLLLSKYTVPIQCLEKDRRIQTWWHQGLRDGKHYIGVRCSHIRSDLIQIFEMLQRNQTLALQIAKNGHEFATECMTDIKTHTYFRDSVEYPRLAYTPKRIGSLIKC